mgnify:CR=1 FL=1
MSLLNHPPRHQSGHKVFKLLASPEGKVLAQAEVCTVIRRIGLRGLVGYWLRQAAHHIDGLTSCHFSVSAYPPPVSENEMKHTLALAMVNGLQRACETISELQRIQLVDQQMEAAAPHLFEGENKKGDAR